LTQFVVVIERLDRQRRAAVRSGARWTSPKTTDLGGQRYTLTFGGFLLLVGASQI